ncbi:unnamed protein product, partial [Rotaria sp. Silwood2]
MYPETTNHHQLHEVPQQTTTTTTSTNILIDFEDDLSNISEDE